MLSSGSPLYSIEGSMAKGWESKGIEQQQDAREQLAPALRPLGTSLAAQRARQNLELQREQVLNERTSNAHRRAALAAALAHIEAQLQALG